MFQIEIFEIAVNFVFVNSSSNVGENTIVEPVKNKVIQDVDNSRLGLFKNLIGNKNSKDAVLRIVPLNGKNIIEIVIIDLGKKDKGDVIVEILKTVFLKEKRKVN